MNRAGTLIKRNLRLFLRDKATVFFSFLSTIIVIALYFLFIAKIYTEGIDDPTAGGISMMLDAKVKDFIVYLQMMAGVLVLNAMSLATGAFSTIAKDFEDRRIDNFLLTPTRAHEMILAYFTTGFLASFLINSFTWVLSVCIIGLATGYWLAIGTFLMALVVLFAASLIACSIMLLLTVLVKSSAAIGVINGVSGTFFGFLCGIYMPYSMLGDAPKAIGSLLPFTHLTIWLKRVVLGDAFAQAGIPSTFTETLYREHFSASGVGFLSLSAPLWVMMLASGLVAVLCLGISWRLLNKRIGQRH